jgi:hypothetical protein
LNLPGLQEKKLNARFRVASGPLAPCGGAALGQPRKSARLQQVGERFRSEPNNCLSFRSSELTRGDIKIQYGFSRQAAAKLEPGASPHEHGESFGDLARFPLERNRSSDKKWRQIRKLERILIAKVCQFLRNSL